MQTCWGLPIFRARNCNVTYRLCCDPRKGRDTAPKILARIVGRHALRILYRFIHCISISYSSAASLKSAVDCLSACEQRVWVHWIIDWEKSKIDTLAIYDIGCQSFDLSPHQSPASSLGPKLQEFANAKLIMKGKKNYRSDNNIVTMTTLICHPNDPSDQL